MMWAIQPRNLPPIWGMLLFVSESTGILIIRSLPDSIGWICWWIVVWRNPTRGCCVLLAYYLQVYMSGWLISQQATSHSYICGCILGKPVIIVGDCIREIFDVMMYSIVGCYTLREMFIKECAVGAAGIWQWCQIPAVINWRRCIG